MLVNAWLISKNTTMIKVKINVKSLPGVDAMELSHLKQ